MQSTPDKRRKGIRQCTIMAENQPKFCWKRIGLGIYAHRNKELQSFSVIWCVSCMSKFATFWKQSLDWYSILTNTVHSSCVADVPHTCQSLVGFSYSHFYWTDLSIYNKTTLNLCFLVITCGYWNFHLAHFQDES